MSFEIRKQKLLGTKNIGNSAKKRIALITIAKSVSQIIYLGWQYLLGKATNRYWYDNVYNHENEKYEIILSFASINHIYESPYNALKHAETYKEYVEIAANFHSLLKPGGVAVVTDACRYGLYSVLRKLGVNRPWRPQKK